MTALLLTGIPGIGKTTLSLYEIGAKRQQTMGYCFAYVGHEIPPAIHGIEMRCQQP